MEGGHGRGFSPAARGGGREATVGLAMVGRLISAFLTPEESCVTRGGRVVCGVGE